MNTLKELTPASTWVTVKNAIARTNNHKMQWRFRLGVWTCAKDASRETGGVRYRWAIQGDQVRCTQIKTHQYERGVQQKYRFEMLPGQLAELTSAIILNPNTIIPDFKD